MTGELARDRPGTAPMMRIGMRLDHPLGPRRARRRRGAGGALPLRSPPSHHPGRHALPLAAGREPAARAPAVSARSALLRAAGAAARADRRLRASPCSRTRRRRRPARRSSSVLDVSASMQAEEGDGSRFETARRARPRAVAEVARERRRACSSRPGRVRASRCAWTSDRASVRAALEALAPRDTPTDLGPALELARGLAAERAGAAVAVFTDLPPESSGLSPEARARSTTCRSAEPTTTSRDRRGHRHHAAVPRSGRHDRDRSTCATTPAPRAKSVLEARVGGAPWARRASRSRRVRPSTSCSRRRRRAARSSSASSTDDALAVDDRRHRLDRTRAPPLDLLLVTDSRALADAFGEVAGALAGSRVEVTSRERYEAGAARGPPRRALRRLRARRPCRSRPTRSTWRRRRATTSVRAPAGATDAVVVDWDRRSSGARRARRAAGARRRGRERARRRRLGHADRAAAAAAPRRSRC